MKLKKTVAIIGQGYVGLPLAMQVAEIGHKVIGIDIDKSRVKSIKSGISPVEDVTDLTLTKNLSRNYDIVSNFNVVSEAQVVIICVPTPLTSRDKPDLKFLKIAVENISPYIKKDTLIVNESTSFPGTLRNVVRPIIVNKVKFKPELLYFASAPERVNPLDKNWNLTNTPRIVSGLDDVSTAKAIEFYNSICRKVVQVETPEIAELAKLVENSFRLVNIAFVNELATVCVKAGISVNKVLDAASTKPYGFMPFRPGVGVGGHCIPVDPHYLVSWASTLGDSTALVETASKINRRMPINIAKVAQKISLKNKSKRALVIGVTYKSGVSDVRETPAKSLLESLQKLGFRCSWYDPLVPKWRKGKCSDLRGNYEVVVITTVINNLDLNPLLIKKIPILDCTNFYNISGVTNL
jgi:UDP-N-acetyl-D-glucosamine dehydrogenase